MSLLDILVPKARAATRRTLVLAEGNDPRVMQAAVKIAQQEIAKVIVLATPEEAIKSAQGISFTGLPITVLDYANSPDFERIAQAFFELRRHKGITLDQARVMIKDRLYFGDMMVRLGLADGLVAGSIASTPDMVRAAFQCVGTALGIKTGSSFFAMELAKPTLSGDSVLFFADSGVNPDPTAEQLVDITVATIRSYNALIGKQARVAMLSFSTHGSTRHPLVDKMAKATELTKKRVAELGLDAVVDGELQVDAAIVPEVAAKKCPGSPLKGGANIFIFPDLQSGNISYKLTERLAGAIAFGPIMQGLAKPVNDLSRGCSVDDIVGVAVITVCLLPGK
ncbi:MAG: phosphate acetyltransferase [bacterium]